MFNKIQCLPKTINLGEYFKKHKLEKLAEKKFDTKYPKVYFLLHPKDDEWHLSYAYYGWDGVECYFPLENGAIAEWKEEGYLGNAFDGGFSGQNIDELVDQMLEWLSKEGLLTK